MLIHCLLFSGVGTLAAQSVEWAKSIALIDDNLAAGITLVKDVETDGDGNVYLAGQFIGTQNFGGGPVTSSGQFIATQDGFIAKYDPAGNFIWLETFPALFSGVEDVEIDAAGNIYLLANFEEQITIAGTDVIAGSNDQGVAFAKLSAERVLLWVSSVMQINTFNSVLGRRLDVGTPGRVYVTGLFTGTLTVGGNQLIATASEGSNFLAALNRSTGFWEYSMALGNASPLSTRIDVAAETDGDFYLAGTSIGNTDFGGVTVTFPDEQFAYLAKYNANGALQWVRHSAGSSGSLSDEAAAVVIANSGDVYVAGSFGSGTFLFSGTTLTNPDGCCSEFFVAKLDADGTLLWIKQSQGPFATEFELSEMDLSEDGGVSATGVYINAQAQPITLGQTPLPQGPGDDVFAAHYSAAGDLLWAKGIHADNTSSECITNAGAGSVIIGGVFAGTFSLDGITLQSVPQDFKPNMYFLKINATSGATDPSGYVTALPVYPNPASSYIHVQLPDNADGYRVRLTDMAGRTVLQEPASGPTVAIHLPRLPGGSYLLLLEKAGTLLGRAELVVKN